MYPIFINKLNSRIVYSVNRYILPLLEEKLLPITEQTIKYPPIFIVGAPRCGSTLLMQVITDIFQCGYLSNFHCKWFGSPSLANFYLKKFNISYKSSSKFVSFHGKTKGLYEPSECPDWWYQFFELNSKYEKEFSFDEKKIFKLKSNLIRLTKNYNCSIIFKNLYASSRISVLSKIFPESLYIIFNRNELDTAHSILEGRMKTFGNYENWWSLEPANIDKLKKLPVHEQVVEQIRSIYKMIDKDLSKMRVPKKQILRLNYENFCKDVKASTDTISNFFNVNACSIKLIKKPPFQFKMNNEIRINKSLYKKLENYINESFEK